MFVLASCKILQKDLTHAGTLKLEPKKLQEKSNLTVLTVRTVYVSSYDATTEQRGEE